MTMRRSCAAASMSAELKRWLVPRTTCFQSAKERRGRRTAEVSPASAGLLGSPPHCTVWTTSGRNQSTYSGSGFGIENASTPAPTSRKALALG
jgi:hypothetical protein